MFHIIREKSFWRHLIPIYLPFALFVLFAVWSLHYFNQQNQLAALSRHADHAIDEATGLIHDEMSRITSDITFLVQSSALRRYTQGRDSAEQLGKEWQRFMLLNKYYDQIRLLDVNGKEKIRVDFHNGQALLIPEHALQDKGKRYYFKEAMALQPGEIYASALDLNIENGVIVEPYQPTMRFAIQVTDPQARVRGLLVMNFSAHHLLQHLRQLSIMEHQGIYLINKQGYWLLGPNRKLEWGFMFPDTDKPASRVDGLYPDVWHRIFKDYRGIHIDNTAVIGFQSLNSKTPAGTGDSRQLLPFTGSDFPWTILTVLDRDSAAIMGLGQFAYPSRAPLLILIALLLIITVAATSWKLTRKLYKTEQANLDARAETNRLQSILANLQDAIFLIDENRCITSCNPAAERLFCLDAGQIKQRQIRELLPLLLDTDQHTGPYPMQAGIYRTEISIGQQRVPVDVMVYDIRNVGVCHSLMIVQDARDRVDSEQQLHYMASHDQLTGLPNRFTMEEKTRSVLQNTLHHEWQTALLHMDLDNFKQVIDTRGHRAGDEFLKRVAERLRLGIPETCQIGRLGNDEFIILMPDISDQSEAAELAMQIIHLMAEPFTLNSATYHISVSIGISFAPLDSDSADILFQHASTARHKAKSQGGNTFVIYDPVMNQEAKRLLAFENELRLAKTENQFLLYYQPKQAIADGEISGVEALLRWEHPREGLLVPHAFIDKLEHSQELLIDVGYWVLEEACKTITQWNLQRLQHKLPPLNMAVNFSNIQFRDMDMINRIRNILTRTGCEASWLEMEITESVLMDNLGSVGRRLWALHDTGISIAIDDFGIGYSSLAYLKKLPVKVLKIDRSFVSGLPDDKDDRAIVEATVTMAKHMGLKVVAEGVETETHYNFLKDIDVDYLQGYWYAKPMRKEKVEAQFLQQTNESHVITLYQGKGGQK